MEPWTIQPTSRERKFGRLLRDGEAEAEVKVEDKSLVNEEVEVKAEEKVEEKAEEKVEEKIEEKVEEQKAPEPLTVEQLAVPEGFELKPEMADEFLKIVNDGEMDPKDRANALIALHAKTITDALEASSAGFDEMQNKWRDEVKADPDIGGAKLQPVLANVGKLLDEFGSPELKGVFDFTGAGNNVHIIKFLNAMADKLTEGKFFTGGSPAGANDPDAGAKRMFPSMKG